MVSVIVAVWRVLSFYRKYHMYTQSTYVTSCPPQHRGSRRRRQPNRLRVNMNTKYCAQSKCAKCPTGFEDSPLLWKQATGREASVLPPRCRTVNVQAHTHTLIRDCSETGKLGQVHSE